MFYKPWVMLQNPVTATLTGTSAVTFAKDGVASIDVGKYTLSLAVGSYNQIFAKMMPVPTGTLASSLTLVDGDLELTGTGTDIDSAGDPGSIGTMTVGTAGSATATAVTANKSYTVQLSAQGQKHLTDYLQKVYARHDGQTPSASVPANYRISSSTSSATLDVLTTSTLVYDKNAPAGHTDAEVSGTIDPVTATAGTTTTVTDKTYALKGYTLTKWNSKADGTGTSYAAGSSTALVTVVSPKTTLYAQWKANSYTLVYHTNNSDGEGSGSAGDQTAEDSLTYDQAATLRGDGTFTRPGWHFLGWNTKADGTGTSYTAGQKITKQDVNTLVGDLPAGGKVNLYAQWEKLNATLPRTGTDHVWVLPVVATVLLLLACSTVTLWRRLSENGGGR